MRSENPQDQRNHGEIYPGNLRCSCTCNPIRVYIPTTCHEEHGIRVCGSGEDSSGKRFDSHFLQKIKISLSHCKHSKYNSSQEIWSGLP